MDDMEQAKEARGEEINIGIQKQYVGTRMSVKGMSIIEDSTFLKATDIYLTPTFQEGKPLSGKALRVFLPKIEPVMEIREERYKPKNGDEVVKEIPYYQHFDEKNGYKYYQTKVDGLLSKKKSLRNVQREDGGFYFYSQNRNLGANNGNTIQILVCVTMYSEKKDFLVNTLKGFSKIGVSNKQIVVVVLQDGIMKMKEEMENFYSELDFKSGRPLELKKRRQIIQQQMDFLKMNNQESALTYNGGIPYTIPKQTALLYQDKITFDKNQNELITFTVFKHLNGQKLSSHLWFFEGFCRQFQPKYCALVDAGTQPDSYGLVNMYNALEGNSQIGGVCGFMGLKAPAENAQDLDLAEQQELLKRMEETKYETSQGHPWLQKYEEEKKQNQNNKQKTQQSVIFFEEQQNEIIQTREKDVNKNLMITFNVFYLLLAILSKLYKWSALGIIKLLSLFNKLMYLFLETASLAKAQNYEYTTAHMIDKNFESALGFLHVLPGAWSAYRYAALNISKEHRENLIQKRYLKQILCKSLMNNTIQEQNMFLAEDRILCLGIFCQVNSNYLLKFIPDAKAFTDPVNTLEEFLPQRRRWINSSWFALNYVLQNYEYHIEDSSHSYFTKYFTFRINMLFAKLGQWTTYYIPALYIFVSIICCFQFLQPSITQKYMKITSKTEFTSSKDITCIVLEEEPENLCKDAFTEECYIDCQIQQNPNFFFSLLNFIPACFVVLYLMIILSSLLFKPKDITITDSERTQYNILKFKMRQGIVLSQQDRKDRAVLDQKVKKLYCY